MHLKKKSLKKLWILKSYIKVVEEFIKIKTFVQ